MLSLSSDPKKSTYDNDYIEYYGFDKKFNHPISSMSKQSVFPHSISFGKVTMNCVNPTWLTSFSRVIYELGMIRARKYIPNFTAI